MLIAFYPDSIKANPQIPPIAITGFKVFDKPLPLQKAVFSLKEIQLSYRQNFFSFEFAAMDYTVPAKNQYAYKLEGFDHDWLYSGTRRYASYTNAEPGEYVFRVKGSNSDGVWNEAGASIKIIITPPFWESWWFRALAFAAIGLFVWGAYRYRVNRLLELERLRTRLAADLHDEIAGNLSSIAMFGKIIQDQETSPGENPLARSQLLERIVALSQESVTAIREIIAINNAIKHSGGTELAIYASCKTGHLHISIVDNGSGIDGADSATRFSGKGLGTMKARAEQLNGSFGMLSDDSGTTVNVTIKI